MPLKRTATFKSLMTFKVLFENNSATKAAHALGISQSGVSRSLALLEKQLQFPLFIRDKNRLIATPEAHSLYSDLLRMNNALIELEKNIQSIRDYGTSRVRIAATPGLGMNYAPQVVSRAFSALDNGHISFDILSSDEVARELEEGVVDIGFVALPIASDTLKFEEINRSEAVCILPKSHPLSNKDSINISDFANQHLVIVKQPNDTVHKVAELLDVANIKVGKKTECNISAMGGFVAHSMGMGIINYTTVQDVYAHQVGVEIKPFTPTLHFTFALAYRPEWEQSKTLELLRDAIKETNLLYTAVPK